MKRWAWNIFCALSLLIFATSVTLWPWSYLAQERFVSVDVRPDATGGAGSTRSRYYGLLYANGGVGMGYGCDQTRRFRPLNDYFAHDHLGARESVVQGRSTDDKFNWQRAGFQLLHNARVDAEGWASDYYIAIPLWLFLIFAVPPLLWWRRRRKLGGRGFPLSPREPAPAEGEKRSSNDVASLRP